MATEDISAVESFMKDVQEHREKVAVDVTKFKFRKERVRMLSAVEEMPDKINTVLYWMSREQRVQDNWAMLFAQKLALKNKCKLKIVFCLVPTFLDATYRHYKFMLQGLQDVESECKSLNIPFHLLLGDATTVLPDFITKHKVGALVLDHSSLRVPKKWVTDLLEQLPKDLPVGQVDGHNVVPVWEASPKKEYMARTIRSKITPKLPTFLTEYPPVIAHPYNDDDESMPEPVDWSAVDSSLKVDRSVGPVDWAQGGPKYGFSKLYYFIRDKVKDFAAHNNNPGKDCLSNLSPWIHFGHISAARCVLEVNRLSKSSGKAGAAIFLEQCVIRRELSNNYCFYEDNYDNLGGAPDWAVKTLEDHRKDKREYLYSLEEFDRAKTHDDLWNAAQVQLLTEGKMHGFLRMYWAKKILEWTPNAETALATSIYLNDRYSMDGRDPNGFVGCMWSVAGLHDQGWQERKVFGKVRFMNYQGCKRKMDVPGFVARYPVKGNLPGAANVKKSLPVTLFERPPKEDDDSETEDIKPPPSKKKRNKK